MLTFDDYKAKISIIQILEDLGYKQDITNDKYFFILFLLNS